jgi:hypothetical protein
MVIHSGETEVFKGSGAQRLEQTLLGRVGVNLTASQLLDQFVKLGRVHQSRPALVDLSGAGQ